MAKVDGFHVQFSRRGAWTADLLSPGKEVEVIPVTWVKDWDRTGGMVFVWMKKMAEVEHHMARKGGFRIAIGNKKSDGSASQDDIVGIFFVEPQERSHDPLGITCKMIKRAKPSDP